MKRWKHILVLASLCFAATGCAGSAGVTWGPKGTEFEITNKPAAYQPSGVDAWDQASAPR